VEKKPREVEKKAAEVEKQAGEAEKKAGEVKKKERIIRCVFKGLDLDKSIPAHEMQVAISSILHKEYGVVPVAFAKMPAHGPFPVSGLITDSQPKASTDSEPKAGDDSQASAASKPPEPTNHFSAFINSISSHCMQSTKVLLITEQPSVSQRAELFILEQSLDCFSLYNELAAEFFIDMREELQQRIHGEDADEICRSACEHIKRSSAASLPLHFHKMALKTQERLIRYLPEQFLRRSFVSGEEDPKLILDCEHDFDFPVFADKEDAGKEPAMKKWTAYWEYLFLNCGDSRPYAPPPLTSTMLCVLNSLALAGTRLAGIP
jgi:hypothetical protein